MLNSMHHGIKELQYMAVMDREQYTYPEGKSILEFGDTLNMVICNIRTLKKKRANKVGLIS